MLDIYPFILETIAQLRPLVVRIGRSIRPEQAASASAVLDSAERG
ncbi:MAG: hypothetical protein R3B07_16980 [Polyangiaceae bacterium]